MFPFRQYYNPKKSEEERLKIEGDDVKEVVEAAFPTGKPPVTGDALMRLIRNVDIYVSFPIFYSF